MNDEITFENYDKPVEYNLKKLEQSLIGISSVSGIQHRLSETFTLLFRDIFADFPLTSFSGGVPNRSNWTHHTYYTIRTTAKSMFLSCTFETMGRLDAVIETYSEYPGIILVAEWETNAFSVFGSGKELEKLWASAEGHKHADAFLFTYCPFNKLSDFTRQVVVFWQSKLSARERHPSLFLNTVVTRRNMRDDEFIFLRTMEISSENVGLWHDVGFVELEDYRSCIEIAD